MNVEPASFNQIRLGEDGRLIEVSADVGGVVEKLREIDKGLRVRFAERGHCWIVYHEWHEGCPRNNGNEGSTYLINTSNAYQGPTGAWLGLDDRIVDRMREIGSETYDFAAKLEASRREREDKTLRAKSEKFGEIAEKGAHALRKDLGDTSRAVIPRDV